MKKKKCWRQYFCPRALFVLLLFVLLALLAFTALAHAQDSITFVLGKKGQSGCQVCHGDPKLTKITPEGKKSLYINQTMINQSVHKDIACTSCHVGFTSQPHQNVSQSYKVVASLACRGCHKQTKPKKKGETPKDIDNTYLNSIHGKILKTGDPASGATCGDCHGSHNVQKVTSESFHQSARQSCGRDDCHNNGEKYKNKYWDNYDDHYHGRAYKLGEYDAPACWQCHGSHQITAKNDPKSPVNDKNLGKQCGSCHHHKVQEKDVDDTLLQYKSLIHNRAEVEEDNFLMDKIIIVIGYIKDAASWFTNL